MRAVAILLALLAGKEFNIKFLALVGVAFGLITSVTLIVLSPAVWGGDIPAARPA